MYIIERWGLGRSMLNLYVMLQEIHIGVILLIQCPSN